MRSATAPTVLASMPPLSTLTPREGQADLFSRRSDLRSFAAAAAGGQKYHQNRQYTGGDGSGQRQP